MERHCTPPIAITGFGIRFPGNIHNEETLWNLISDGKDAIVDIPEDRWNTDHFYDPDPDKPGKMYVKKGGFLQTPVDEFDAFFFGITPREAACMDPQQRLLLQVTWEALHNAGIVPETLAGGNTGVYVGAFTLDNLIHQMGPQARDLIGPHTAVGSTMTILSNRLSYLLDLRGPSLTLDTACSSSLVALHHGCQAIWTGACDLALVGGVNVMFRPEYLIAMCKGKFLAKDGYCKSFDERADGYGRGEGAGAVVLKSLAAAQRDGDIIHGIIRDSGVNQDGRSNGITSPNRESQIALIQEVHARAGVKPSQISYVEAHGTGTQAGDSAESTALGEALGIHRAPENPLPVGSIKANIGHLEAASGIAGLIKTMLCLKHRQIPPIANLQNPNPNIPFAQLGIHLPRQLEPLKKQGDLAYAALNSFGYGGTNAHVLLQEVPEKTITRSAPRPTDCHLLTISAKDQQALTELAQRYQCDIAARPEVNLTDYCSSAALHRGHYQHRLAICAGDRPHLLQQLDQFVQYQQGENLRRGEINGEPQRPVFVFTGMGPQWWAMGRELLRGSKVFRDAALRCDKAFKQIAGWSILREMLAAESASKMASTTIAQPANFLLQSALAALWKSRGIIPAAIVGHSVGEVTAAYVSGVLTLEEAALVSYQRSQIQNKAAGLGGMLAVGLSQPAARDLLNTLTREEGAKINVDIAAVNGPDSVTLSGEQKILDKIAARLDRDGIFQRALQVEVAYHSPYMDPLLAEMHSALDTLKPQPPNTPLYSTVTGEAVTAQHTAQAYGAEYWCQNARQAVLFAPAMQALVDDGYSLFLEVGPHPVLSTSIKQCAAAANKTITAIASLHREKAESETFNLATAELYTAGCDIDWRSLYPNNARYVQLPDYPWQNTKYWLESDVSYQDRLASPEHPLLGLRQNSPQPVWLSRLNEQTLPYLKDHCVEDLVVLPGAAYVELGLASHRHLHQQSQWVLENLNFFNALLVSDGDEPELHTGFNPAHNSFSIYSKSAATNQWQAHASGYFSTLPPPEPEALALGDLLDAMHNRQNKCEHYRNMNCRKLQYGPSFQGVEEIWQGEDCLLARIVAPQPLRREMQHYHLHPAILDACFQSLLSVLSPRDRRSFIPTNIRTIRFYATPSDVVYCYGSIESICADTLIGDLTICDESGKVLVELFGIKARSLSQSEHLPESELDTWLYDIEWEPVDTPAVAAGGRWVVAGNLTSVDSLAAQCRRGLLKAGCEVISASYGKAFLQQDEHRFTLCADSQDDFASLAEAISSTPCDGLLYFPPGESDNSPLADEKTLSPISSQKTLSPVSSQKTLSPVSSQKTLSPVSSQKTLSALAAIQGLVRGESHSIRQLCFITHGAQAVAREAAQIQLNETGIVALLRVAANEYPEHQFRSIDVDAQTPAHSLLREVLGNSGENELMLRGENCKAMRMVRRQAADLRQRRDSREETRGEFYIETAGVESVALRPADLEPASADEIKLAVAASTTIGCDLIASRSVSHQITDPVQAPDNYGLSARLHLCHIPGQDNTPANTALLLTTAPLASHFIAAKKDLLLPAEEDRVTADNLNSVYALITAYRMLVDVAHIKTGQSILIHAADTTIGRAAVDIALSRNADVHVTLDSLKDTDSFLGRGVKSCFSYRTLGFSQRLSRPGSDGGLDIVLNPFGGEIANHSVQLVKSGGCLLNLSDEPLAIKPGISTHMISLDRLLLEHPAKLKAAFTSVCQGLEKGTYSGIHATGIEIDQLKTLNKSDLLDRAYTLKPARPDSAALFKAGPTTVDSEATYLITGGFGGFGQAVTRYMAKRGARHLVIVSRSGAKRPEDLALVEELQAAGVSVSTPQLDVADAEQVTALFAGELASWPALKGIIHTAGVLDDGPLNFVSKENIQRVMGPKVLGAWNLHQQSKDQPLDFFIVFSSVASMIGAAGQTSYVISNVWLDNFAHYRQTLGLPAVSISWGALGEVGMAAVDPEVVAYFERVGLRPISPGKAIDSFEHLLNWQQPHLGLVDMNWAAWASYYPAWAKSPRYEHLVPETDNTATQGGDWIRALLQQPEQSQLEDILQRLTAEVAKVLKLPPEKISAGDNLPRLGIDSLLAMELQVVIQQALNVRLSTLELMKGSSLQQMSVQILNQLLETSDTPSAGHPPSTSIDGIDELEEEQIDSMLSEVFVE